MPLWKDGGFVDDPWRTDAGDDASPALAGGVLLTLAEWAGSRTAAPEETQLLGVRIDPGEAIDPIVPDLGRLNVIALAFPKFSDGRSFSKARLLRQDHGFTGEIRAVGDVLWDQLQLMARCGFDAFDITDEPTLKALRDGKKPVMTDYYQPGFGPETRDGAPPRLGETGGVMTTGVMDRATSDTVEDDAALILRVVDHHGVEHEVEALEGFRVMEVIRDWDLGIKAECGGACACATCHIYVDRDWAERLVPPTDEELDRLDEAPRVEPNSRLSCQILMRPEFNGLKVTLAPGSEPD